MTEERMGSRSQLANPYEEPTKLHKDRPLWPMSGRRLLWPFTIINSLALFRPSEKKNEIPSERS